MYQIVLDIVKHKTFMRIQCYVFTFKWLNKILKVKFNFKCPINIKKVDKI